MSPDTLPPGLCVCLILPFLPGGNRRRRRDKALKEIKQFWGVGWSGHRLGKGGWVEQVPVAQQQPGSAEEPVQGPFLTPTCQQRLFSHPNRSGEHTNGPDSSLHPGYLLFVGQQIFALYFKVVHPACGASLDLAAGVGSNRGGTGAVVWGTAVGLHMILGRQGSWLSAWSTGSFLFLCGYCELQYFEAVFLRASISLGLGSAEV